jgi:integrase
VRRFLADAMTRVKSNTLQTYRQLLSHFTGAFGNLLAAGLTKKRLTHFASRREWSDSYRSNLIGTITSVYRWGVENKLVVSNPVEGIKRPRKASRGASCVVTPEAFARLRDAASATFRPLLVLLYETGARPSELTRIEAADIDFVIGVARLVDHKTAESSGKPRLIVLSDSARDVCRELAKQRPTGTLLATVAGKPWTKSKIVRAMQRTCRRAGVQATAYGMRHTYATRALVAGIPDATVAALLGQSSTDMLHKHYSHLSEQTRALRDAANRIADG